MLKVGHHGSAYSSSPAFISAVHPKYAIISVGRHNMFGHPAPTTIETLEHAGTTVYRTDEVCAVTVVAGGSGIAVSNFCRAKHIQPYQGIPTLAKYGGMESSEVARSRAVDDENSPLRRIVAIRTGLMNGAAPLIAGLGRENRGAATGRLRSHIYNMEPRGTASNVQRFESALEPPISKGK